MTELTLALGIGVFIGSGVWLLLRPRTYQLIIGLALIGYGVNPLHLLDGQAAHERPAVLSSGR